jgi:hypothetical protein
MIASMRAIGYDLAMAIADLIDNSIYAQAKNVWIDYHWEGPDSWIRVTDNGKGMNEDELKEAMRLGSKSPNEEREPDDLGRFGLGLKTASFSQCKLLTVRTKTKKGIISTRCWDLDHIEKTREWELGKEAPDGTEKLLSTIKDLGQGTVVLWQKLDRFIDNCDADDDKAMNEFNKKFLTVKWHLEMIFHKYIAQQIPLKIKLGVAELRAWDPYLKANSFTQELASERYEDGTVKVMPYVLPHVSKRSPQEKDFGGGPKGWNAQQGFYVYRNRRMIVPGGYLDFDLKTEEHYKLARIMLDITNKMDADWKIDVRKATAIPPDRLRNDLEKVAKAARAEAQKVYRARLGSPRTYKKSIQDVWLKRRRGDKIVYIINTENEVIKSLLNEEKPKSAWIKKLFHVIENTLPNRLIIMDNADYEDCHVDLPPELNKPLDGLIELCKEFYRKYRSEGKTHEEAVDIVTSIEPFNTHPEYRAILDDFEEGGKKK